MKVDMPLNKEPKPENPVHFYSTVCNEKWLSPSIGQFHLEISVFLVFISHLLTEDKMFYWHWYKVSYGIFMQSDSLSLFPSLLRPGVVVPVKDPYMYQIDLFKNYLYSIGPKNYLHSIGPK